ncbi:esterase OVCA2-like [Lingula anatina]|uniref:Esterase OVCA2-like n=1 Tax=Lingula anatina TaxID=7574 RepID=A0A1S3KA08_LINAN|nr:esterase OVCA2-like [Lingula anatina]|eukprot:XP_013419337.1 esterase OVCA2-like [Lingula anatina]
MAQDSKETLKILCIHGYRQNGQAFRERTGAFRKITKKYAELVFIDAPNSVPPLEDAADGDTVDQRGWWFSREDDYFRAQDDTDCCKGFDQSLQTIQQAFQEQGPFDGVLGFSQGAALVALMCGLREKDEEACPFKFDFVMLVAGFKSHSKPHEEIYKIPITCPSLHVFGDTDKVIPKDMSEDLLQYFVEPRTLEHPGGHFIPASGPHKKVYTEFLENMLLRKKQRSAKS